MEAYGVEFVDEKTEEDLSSNARVDVTEMECLLGESGFGVRVGDADADRDGGDPGGVSRGVLVWDASKRLADMRGAPLDPSFIGCSWYEFAMLEA